MKIKVGFGYDVHKLAEGEELWLGGILVPHSKGSVGHSDADVLLHVVCDALLGAINKRDIGFHFPDTDPAYKGIDSKELLRQVMVMVREDGWTVSNVDSTIALQKPKIGPHIDAMRNCMAEVMNIPNSDIAVKATTTENLGFVGTEQGVAAFATILIQKD